MGQSANPETAAVATGERSRDLGKMLYASSGAQNWMVHSSWRKRDRIAERL